MGQEVKTPDFKEDKPINVFKSWINEMPRLRKTLLLIIPIIVLANGAISYFLPRGNWQLAGIITMAIALSGTAFWLFSSLLTVYEKQNAEIVRGNKELVNKIGDLGDPLRKALLVLSDNTPEYEIAMKLDQATTEASKQLIKPKTFYTGVDEYINGLKDNLHVLMSGSYGKVYAVCGDKPWSDSKMNEWFDLNVLALSKKVSINRIFLQQKAFNSEVENIMQAQADKGINVWYAKREVYERIPFFKEIPEGFGFVIFETYNSRKVIMHHYPDKTNSVLWENPLITSQFKDAYVELVLLRDIEKKHPTSQVKIDDSDLIFTIRKQANQLKSDIDFLSRHSFSNLQINYLSWRLKSEIAKLEQVINDRKIKVLSLDKFHYLSDVLGNLLETLKTDDTFRVVSHVEVWGGENLGAERLLAQCDNAVENIGAKVERLVYIDSKKTTNPEYINKLRIALTLFSEHGMGKPKFFIADKLTHPYSVILKNPMAFINEAKGNHRLQICTEHLIEENKEVEPSFELLFYRNDEKQIHAEVIFNELFSDSRKVELFSSDQVAEKFGIELY